MRKNIRRVRRRRIAGLVLIVSLTIAGFSAAIRWLSPLDAKSAGDMIYASYTVIPGSVVKLPIERTNTPVITKAQEESASEITEDHETTGTTVLDMMPIEAASERIILMNRCRKAMQWTTAILTTPFLSEIPERKALRSIPGWAIFAHIRPAEPV